MTSYTAADLAQRIGATLVGDGELKLAGVAPLETAGPDRLSFCAGPKYIDSLRASAAGAVIVSDAALAPERVQLVCPDPYLGLRGALLAFHRLTPEFASGVAPGAHVDSSAVIDGGAGVGAGAVVEAGVTIGAGSYVASGCVVGRGSRIGRECYLYPRATLYHGVTLGDRVIVHSGAVIGADGFGYARTPEGALKLPQVGAVVIGDDVEIGANTTIDRGTLDDTRIGRGTKVDNLVMIAHNVQIGEHCIIVSQVGIAGSTRVGNGCVFAGQVGIADHLDIGDGVTLGAQSGVHTDLEGGKTYLGAPAREIADAKRIFAYLTKLPEWARRLRELERTVVGKQIS